MGLRPILRRWPRGLPEGCRWRRSAARLISWMLRAPAVWAAPMAENLWRSLLPTPFLT